MTVSFVTRAKRDETVTARRRIWRSLCGRFRVVEAVSLYGLPTVYRAEQLDEFGWNVISRHCKKERAVEALKKLAER